ncbi:MAG: bifunctional hydroxymethylpyrimidine kinase/phosphomethylpyrimidine kinase [Lachnospiraceae bacterium]|nr:bifunctional hydroxymethylpyrimidine kinase/phosphomethylpyrimidine kinase [Lachnospiraceae bacterium]
MHTVLTIAGSDSSGGAGIQADIKTMTAHGVYAMSAITALTAQNTTGVSDILNVEPEFLAKELDSVFTDIYPEAVKIGMLSNANIMAVVAMKLVEYRAKNIVLDPVMVATSGAKLVEIESSKFMVNELFPLADVITPNIPEAEAITGKSIDDFEDMTEAALIIYGSIKEMKKDMACAMRENGAEDYMYVRDTAVLIKGGHSVCDANDILVYNDKVVVIEGERIDNPNTHGTGCTLSSAIASNLAMGHDVETSVRNAKKYISNALRANLNLGTGSGPLNHMVDIK